MDAPTFESHARAAQSLKLTLLVERLKRNAEYTPSMIEALEGICTSLANIVVSGNPGYEENWRKIEAYACLVADAICERVSRV